MDRAPAHLHVPGFLFCFRMQAFHGGSMTITPLGDSALVITLGSANEGMTLRCVRVCARALERTRVAGVTDVVPANATIGVYYDPARWEHEQPPLERVRQWISDTLAPIVAAVDAADEDVRTIEIPVCYGGEYGPDLEYVATHAGLTLEAVVTRHSEARYEVSAIGFTPGFPYLRGLPAELETPRKATPRINVAAGSVGIGGALTGIYPLNSPGGWQIIGRTPAGLFDPRRQVPATLRMGDRVSFKTVSEEDFLKWS
jgi:inhibitor of KinA